MLVVVKAPHTEFRIEGNIPEKYVNELKIDFKDYVSVTDEETPIPFRETDFWRDVHGNKWPAEKLRFYRKANKLTQVELAKKLSTTKQRISNFENEINPISKAMAYKFAEVFQTAAGDFI